MCDSSTTTVDYFNKHIKLMSENGENTAYENVDEVNEFFAMLEAVKEDDDKRTAAV